MPAHGWKRCSARRPLHCRCSSRVCIIAAVLLTRWKHFAGGSDTAGIAMVQVCCRVPVPETMMSHAPRAASLPPARPIRVLQPLHAMLRPRAKARFSPPSPRLGRRFRSTPPSQACAPGRDAMYELTALACGAQVHLQPPAPARPHSRSSATPFTRRRSVA